MSNSINNVDFSLIRYANVWEDPEVLIQGLDLPENKRILSIASAGDNAFALLTTNPELVVAFDISSPQLHLVELKKSALKNLNYADCLAFLGFTSNENRLEVYKELKADLSHSAIDYWNKNDAAIQSGVIHVGKFEKYFQLFSRKVLPLIHSKRKVNELFAEKSAEEQQQFFIKKWNTWRWRLLFKLFFSKWFMGRKGRDKAFLNEVKTNVGSEIFKRSEEHLSSVNCQKNSMLHYIMKGEFGNFLPFYMQEENFNLIKNNLHKIELFNGFPDQAIEKFGKFDAFNLSDIFEYMNDDVFAQTAEGLKNGANKDAKFGYWNLLVDRRISAINPVDFEYLRTESVSLSKVDTGFFYGCFIVDKKNK